MANLAIKGHATRGREVIELLEMLGGINKYRINFTEENLLYTIREGDNVIIATYPNSNINKIFTLEEFLEKYPYKVGDKVVVKGLSEYPKSINFMKWFDDNIHYSFDNETWFLPSALNPYKEENMKDIKISIPKGYEFFGVDEDNQQVVFTKIQLQYPNTYEECCIIYRALSTRHYLYTKKDKEDYPDEVKLLNNLDDLRKLLICCNIYWKIAGEQMGLGKPWEPDWDNPHEMHYTIAIIKGNITKALNVYSNRILVFPTREIRDIFYENFKYLIEECKKLL